MSSLLWITSFPKSGNTWMRILLTEYLASDSFTPGFDDTIAEAIAEFRDCFDEHVGLPSSELSESDVIKLRPMFHELLGKGKKAPYFVRTHQAFDYNDDGEAFFSNRSSCGVVYILRNPLDVAVSYSFFLNRSLEKIIDIMANENAHLGKARTHIDTQMRHHVGSWSGHVQQWTEQQEIPVLTVTYEALLANTQKVFSDVVRFCGLDHDEKKVKQAVERTRFDKLQNKEEEKGFSFHPTGKKAFFRKGVSGDWRNTLSKQHVKQIVSDHRSIMARFGYLEEAEAYLQDTRS